MVGLHHGNADGFVDGASRIPQDGNGDRERGRGRDAEPADDDEQDDADTERAWDGTQSRHPRPG
jgi:hypothetical protein